MMWPVSVVIVCRERWLQLARSDLRNVPQGPSPLFDKTTKSRPPVSDSTAVPGSDACFKANTGAASEPLMTVPPKIAAQVRSIVTCVWLSRVRYICVCAHSFVIQYVGIQSRVLGGSHAAARAL